MATRTIDSTEAQNNFGRIIDDAVEHGTRYVVRRRKVAQAIILGLADFEWMLSNDSEQRRMAIVVRDLAPSYTLGEEIDHDSH
jgi:PHD/YefM family antitoxin component YafN of YafNO toxin-antitoxin module